MRRTRGFTLLEVLVALTVLATVAAMVHAGLQRHLHNARVLETRMLAGWLADNTLTQWQLSTGLPRSDPAPQVASYAGRTWWVERQVLPASGALVPVQVRILAPATTTSTTGAPKSAGIPATTTSAAAWGGRLSVMAGPTQA